MISPCCEQGDLPTLVVWGKASNKSPERDCREGEPVTSSTEERVSPPVRVIEECGNEERGGSGAGGRLFHSFLPHGKEKGATWSSHLGHPLKFIGVGSASPRLLFEKLHVR